MAVTLDGKREIVAQGDLGPIRRQLLEQEEAPQRLSNLDVDQMRRVDAFLRIENAIGCTKAAIALQQQLQNHRGIHDNHRRSPAIALGSQNLCR